MFYKTKIEFLQGPKAHTLNAILSVMKLQLESQEYESEYEFSP